METRVADEGGTCLHDTRETCLRTPSGPVHDRHGKRMELSVIWHSSEPLEHGGSTVAVAKPREHQGGKRDLVTK